MSSMEMVIKELKNSSVQNKGGTGKIYLTLVDFFPLIKIENRERNREALSVLQTLMKFYNRHEHTMDSASLEQIVQYLDALGNCIENFEKVEFSSVGKTTGPEMLAYFMEMHDLTQMDLKKELGGQPVVSDILNGKRDLNVRQIKALAKRFSVGAAVFL
jgi:antitoxin component HigA of HigAB toxin-antitoxin module